MSDRNANRGVHFLSERAWWRVLAAALCSGCPWREFVGWPVGLAGWLGGFYDCTVLVEGRWFPGRICIPVRCVWIEGGVSYRGRRRSGIAGDRFHVAVVTTRKGQDNGKEEERFAHSLAPWLRAKLCVMKMRMELVYSLKVGVRFAFVWQQLAAFELEAFDFNESIVMFTPPLGC